MAKDHRSSHRPSTRPGTDSYRPRPAGTQKPRARWAPREDETRSNAPRPLDSYRPGQEQDEKPREVADLPPVRSAVTKTKHERNANPSTRIHSLKRQLQTQSLPGTVRQERERELAALLFEQEQAKIKQDSKTNLQRYHFVRFLERQNAERSLKKLIRERDSCDDENKQKDLAREIHTTEIDLNYVKYAPLGEKYISLFPKDIQSNKKNKHKRKKYEMNRLDWGVLSAEQQQELRSQYDEAGDIAGSASNEKPPLWHQVEKLMKEGNTQLEALRDGKLKTTKQLKTNLAALGGKEDAQERSVRGRNLVEATPDWLNDDGVIDPADIDSEDEDEDMGDGGFFER